MARMTYTDAFNALEYLDSIGVTGGEAFEEAVQEIADSLGDQDFMEKIQYGVMGDKQRAREFDYSLEEQRALEAKKKKQAQKPTAVPAANATKASNIYGSGPITQAEWDRIRSMYGSEPTAQKEQDKIRKVSGSGAVTQAELDKIRSMYGYIN